MKKKFSYSKSDELSRPRKFVVNSIERISGRKKLEKLYIIFKLNVPTDLQKNLVVVF